MKAFLLVHLLKAKVQKNLSRKLFFLQNSEYLLQAPLIASDFQKKVCDRVMFNNHEL